MDLVQDGGEDTVDIAEDTFEVGLLEVVDEGFHGGFGLSNVGKNTAEDAVEVETEDAFGEVGDFTDGEFAGGEFGEDGVWVDGEGGEFREDVSDWEGWEILGELCDFTEVWERWDYVSDGERRQILGKVGDLAEVRERRNDISDGECWKILGEVCDFTKIWE